MMRKSALCIMLLLAGCAKAPGDIAASAVSTDPYMQMPCPQLVAEKANKKAELDSLAAHQQETSDRDKAWMTIIHVPVSSMTNGDREPEIARTKGELNAIDRAMSSKACG